MAGSWAKIPILRAAMLAHPEAEWLWSVDVNAVFTDMDFSLPLAAYHDRYNLVLYGWPDKLFGGRGRGWGSTPACSSSATASGRWTSWTSGSGLPGAAAACGSAVGEQELRAAGAGRDGFTVATRCVHPLPADTRAGEAPPPETSPHLSPPLAALLREPICHHRGFRSVL
jgi:hypothetical protein